MPRHLDSDRLTRADGRPFLLFGARRRPKGARDEDLRDAGFNAVRVVLFGHESQGPEPLPEPLEGFGFWGYLCDRAGSAATPAAKDRCVGRWTPSAPPPGLLCWEKLNEPTSRYKSNRSRPSAAGARTWSPRRPSCAPAPATCPAQRAAPSTPALCGIAPG